MSEENNLKEIIDDATFDFTMGDANVAIEKLERALADSPESHEAWHALCEIHYSEKAFDKALETAEKAHALKPDDLFINTSLSRIWVELGDKEKAEHFGAQAKIASWKDQIKNPEEYSEDGNIAT
ncbi:MAG: tetratricopeptide repeat protein [Verrucomicrobiota bacterium]